MVVLFVNANRPHWAVEVPSFEPNPIKVTKVLLVLTLGIVTVAEPTLDMVTVPEPADFIKPGTNSKTQNEPTLLLAPVGKVITVELVKTRELIP